jgi:predicted ATPase/DNA-binding CsgD family transcriptional regulator
MAVTGLTPGVESPARLPQYLTSFVGRQPELAALRRLLKDARLLTLTGPGGVGKTRLAVELARTTAERWSDGVWWVDLTATEDPSQVAGATVAAIGLQTIDPPLDVIGSWFVAKHALLVLDNCEHIVAGCAEFCQQALTRCPDLTIVATSREPLGVPGERHWTTPTLVESDALRLFEARAQMATPDYRVGETNRARVAEICARIDGLPLAIELVAARLGVFGEHEILSQLGDPLRLMTRGSRTASPRQQTMAGTIDWSYALLTAEEAALFRALSIFRGGFDLGSAEAICSDGILDVPDLIAGLVQKSMVVMEAMDDGAGRYRLLETQRAYGEARLQETGLQDVVGERHYEYFKKELIARTRSWTGSRATLVTGAAEGRWKRRESANLWSALRWARSHADDMGLGLAIEVAAVESIDINRIRAWLTDLLDTSTERDPVRVWATWTLAFLAYKVGDAQSILKFGSDMLGLARETGDREQLAVACDSVATGLLALGDLEAAEALHREGLHWIERSTNKRLKAALMNSFGCCLLAQGRYELARKTLEDSAAACRECNDRTLEAAIIESLANAELACGEDESAQRSWRTALSTYLEFGNLRDGIMCIGGLSRAATARGDHVRAVRLAAAHQRLCKELLVKDPPFWLDQLRLSQALSRARLGPKKSDDAWRQGLALTLNAATDYALSRGVDEISDSSPLTKREVEVTRLVAAGMTNREIAEKLFIGERTAEGHVERIRGKLGARSRTEVATWATSRGLVDEQKGKGDPFGSPSRTRKHPS